MLEFLEWDSDFFGVQIARVRSDCAASELGNLAELVVQADRDEIDCIYLEVAPPGPEPTVVPEDLGFRLVDVQMLLERPLSTEHCGRHELPASAPSVREGTPDDVDALAPAVEALSIWSRFAVDTRFGEIAAARMYHAWLARAAASADELLLVAEREGSPVGFVTCSFAPDPLIGVFALRETRGGGGRALLAAVLQWVAARGGRRLLTRTQARNVAAMRFYERAGFVACAARYTYHRWLRYG